MQFDYFVEFAKICPFSTTQMGPNNLPPRNRTYVQKFYCYKKLKRNWIRGNARIVSWLGRFTTFVIWVVIVYAQGRKLLLGV